MSTMEIGISVAASYWFALSQFVIGAISVFSDFSCGPPFCFRTFHADKNWSTYVTQTPRNRGERVDELTVM